MHFAPLVAVFLIGCWLWPLPAVSGTDADQVTLYGVFQRSPQGGIVLACPQEPGVVYLPFAAGAVMDNELGIQVQVRGEIRDSFVRDGTTVRVLAVSSIRPMREEYGSTRVTDVAAYGLPGTDAVQIHAYAETTCYLYDRYAVLERQADVPDGHSLRVLQRGPGDNPAAVCESLQGRPLFEIPNGGDFSFAGLSGETLFVQNGPPQAVHGLMAVNLAQQKQTLNTTVIPGSAVAGRVLRYQQTVPGACPAGAIAARPMAFDLATGRTTETGKASCWRQ
jgi:hypothetical protein